MTPQIRMFNDDDFLMVAKWCAGHRRSCLLRELLPRLGVITELDGEPATAVWLRMDNSSPVCWLDCAVSRPGLRPRHVARALLCAADFLASEAKRLGFSVMMATTLPQLARYLRKAGWSTHQEALDNLFVTL